MWTESSLSWPGSANDIQARAASVIDQVGADHGEARLSALEGDAAFGRLPLSHNAQALLNLRSELDHLLSQGQVLTVTPYQFQVGEDSDSGDVLDADAATQRLAEKLTDYADLHRPAGRLHAIVVMLTGPTRKQFAEQLQRVTSVIPLPEWCQAQRQTESLLAAEHEKLRKPAAIVQPRFKPVAPLSTKPFVDMNAALGTHIATLESLASDRVNIIGKLRQLAEKRQATLQTVSDTLQTIQTMDAQVWSVALTGELASLSHQLAEMSPPNYHRYAVASLILSVSPMPFFEELLCSP
ncbi:hypothetical protein [Vibrio gazogenes]|uniref:Uncharacterized protein n=1 Tax=Vibrio gazogenes DSM 21264 = NBRC 103151 TaxID=1123492 RepID=A0A1M5C9W0_VIBGA|nr:hypothetical protein [Vibrio gazogenes]USP16280.1 hypothetical protein MKS89_18025 [Vibrio gazogenes]SHF51470.1 hypothetical protein SAMN02745781_02502 [Vibrio gazogenes DSM 21264] [Vibrio gazogenes DSM 21264 = NBRC 103151]SJN55395.1 hypothetical protein BQ6471_01533 [Vibrio gazogenes]